MVLWGHVDPLGSPVRGCTSVSRRLLQHIIRFIFSLNRVFTRAYTMGFTEELNIIIIEVATYVMSLKVCAEV